MRALRSNGFAALSLLIACTCACDAPERLGWTDETPGDVRAYIASVSLGGVQAVHHDGSPPLGGNGPGLRVETNETVVNGGSSLVSLAAAESLERVVVWVEGVDGWWDLTLPGAVRGTDVRPTIGLPQSLRAGGFRAMYAAAGIAAELGPPTAHDYAVVPVGTGSLQISLSWTQSADVDLHVVEPGGEEIFFNNRTSETDGTLDLDSNRACRIDGINNENVTWGSNQPPAGAYIVRVNTWDSCGQDPVDYVLTITIDGTPLPPVSGTLEGHGDNGAEGAGQEVASFLY